MDAWVLEPAVMRELPLAVWCPVDHQPCPPKVADFFRKSGARPIAMSRFGEQMLRDEGLDPLYVPHGIDTNVFAPLDRDEIRRAAGVDDKFVVGVVANNSGGMSPTSGPPRKAFNQIAMAFASFHREHPDAKLYLHTELTGRPGLEHGLNLPALFDRFEIPDEAVLVTDQAALEFGVSPQSMARLYNSFDVLLNPSYGEGFGIPIVEAQACGTPVIVSDWTSMSELCGAGWKLPGGEPVYDNQHESFFACPQVVQIVEALEDAYENAAGLREKAREFAVQYDADGVTSEFWVPALEALGRPREVPPLPNRATRRAAKKKVAA
jgi:glycosyltransferase involved in cell wall biosynthesis